MYVNVVCNFSKDFICYDLNRQYNIIIFFIIISGLYISQQPL